ncbi:MULTISPECIES: hypothetical protein [unclassified Caballeronia]|uniref:hypothetical protein n=1 Tax=unclassified Caballeronia TaxID=2646786 RepID=UPI0011D1D166|nr:MULTISPECIES: hypothetical protein [unclassified Caballeronia]MCE4543118.1 hypothetical protein [Caballeronia sp. PC1]MCE4567827.1 hypothetical protein [Caballeronia sp. CLC5]
MKTVDLKQERGVRFAQRSLSAVSFANCQKWSIGSQFTGFELNLRIAPCRRIKTRTARTKKMPPGKRAAFHAA